MSNYYTGTLLASPVVNGSSGDTYGTHHSVLGIGGYLEVNTIQDRNNIPVNTVIGLEFDGISSGRRRYGMLVYITSENKTYRLLPTYSVWITLNNSQKVTALSDNNNWIEFKNDSASGERISKIFYQNSHGFSVGNVLGYNNSTNLFIKVTSAKSNTIEPIGIINNVVDNDNFELTFAGYISPITGMTDSSSHTLSGGTVYYLSPSVSGKLTAIKPISTSDLVKPMLVTLTNTNAIVLQYQSNETGIYSAGQGININDLNNNRKISVDLSSFVQNNNINVTLSGTSNQVIFLDLSGNGYGIQYGDNYDPTFLPSSLVDKRYVDTVATGLFPKAAALAAATGNTDLTGGTFNGFIDGLAITDGARILFAKQTNKIDNGVYNYYASGNTFYRSSDFSGSTTGITRSGTLVPVISGNTLHNTIWVVTTENPIIIGTTPIDFTLFSRMTDYIPGVGILINANIISFNGANIAGNSMTWSGNKLNVDPTTGNLANALFLKLYTSVFNLYTGNTQSILNYHQNEILELSARTFTVTGTSLGTGSKVFIQTTGNTNMLFRTFIQSGGTQIVTKGNNIIIYSGLIPTGNTSNNSVTAQNISKNIHKLLHGFGLMDVVAFSGNTYIKAIADGSMDGETIGLVSKVTDGDNFTVTFAGYVSGLTGLATNSTYFLSDVTPGQLTTIEPIDYGHISKPVLVALSSTEGIVFSYRGDIISTGFTNNTGTTINVIIAKTTPYNTSSGYKYIGCSGTTIVNLPVNPTIKDEIIISDIKGNALILPITINGNGHLINGYSYALINTNYGSITLFYNGINWSIIGFTN